MSVRGLNLEIDVIEEGVVLIAASGDLDCSSAPALSDSLRRATVERDGPVLVDLCEVGFMDSSGISVLLNALRRLTRTGRQLLLACPPGHVRRAFELPGLAEKFAIFASRQDALARGRGWGLNPHPGGG